MKKLCSLLMAAMMLLTMVPMAGAEMEAAAIEKATVPFYEGASETATNLSVYFLDEAHQIPYLDAETFVALLKGLSLAEVTTETDASLLLLERCGANALIDYEQGSIAWDDYNIFNGKTQHALPMDPLSYPAYDDEGHAKLFQRAFSSWRAGYGLDIALENFGISSVYVSESGLCLLPAQTLSDLFFAPLGVNLAFNGEAMFLSRDSFPENTQYYAVAAKDRSEELGRFTYNELRLNLQMNYGMAEVRNISSFEELFVRTGTAERLMGTDPVAAAYALSDVLYTEMDDGHSSMYGLSPYVGTDADLHHVLNSHVSIRFDAVLQPFFALRLNYPNATLPYYEVGDTAFVFLEDTTCDATRDYYAEALTLENCTDAVSTVMYAHQQITRTDSPIKNVVLDISGNTNSAIDGAIFAAAWMLGTADANVQHAVTEARSIVTYQADVNRDGAFDINDSLLGKNCYCLISDVTIGGANLLAAILKSSDRVTLLGQPTSGGTCGTQHLVLADGTMMDVSSAIRYCTVKNGSFYDMNRGVDPDVVIHHKENYFDRESLADLVRNLY